MPTVKCEHFQLTKLSISMSTRSEVPALLCQGFLKKRKDKMKLRWVTYWFRLCNTTLFFYTKKNGSASDIRGQYYMREVQSVREVNRSENNRYLFEITMKNGKKKMLAADSADVRQEWIDQLWKAMLLKDPDRPGSISNGELVSDNGHETEESNTESRHSISRESFHSFDEEETQDKEIEQSTEEFLLMENEYDVLPPRKLAEEGIYNSPLSKWPANEGKQLVTDSIYDVPNSLIRKLTQHTVESGSSSDRPESSGLLNDMIACLDSASAAWVKTEPHGSF